MMQGRFYCGWRQSSLRVVLSLLVTVCVSAVAQAGTVLVVGDSIATGYGMPEDRGWVSLLGGRIAAEGYQYKLVNASINGDTSAGGFARLPAQLRQHKPDIVLIELGFNDAMRGLSLNMTRKNLMGMAQLSKKYGAHVLFVSLDAPAKYGPKYGKEFRAMYAAVAHATGAKLLPSFLGKVAKDLDMMQADGVHPNLLAQPVLADSVWPLVVPMLKKSSR